MPDLFNANPKLTIGISFKNPGQYFKITLQSIFAQTFTDWELILIDDGSSDDSLAIAKSLQDPRVRVHSDGESKGLNVRLNQLVQLAKAPYFVRMDADDIMHPQRLEKQFHQLIQYDENTVIGSAAYSIDASSQVKGFRSAPIQQRSSFAARHSFIHPTVAASTEWFRRNPYDEKLVYHRCQDAELWCRTTNKTKFINLPEALLYYREIDVFSLSKYTASSLGVCSMLNQHFYKPHLNFLYLLAMELFKLWIASLLECLGLANWLVAKRYKKISAKELDIARADLEVVEKQFLPLVIQVRL